MKTSEKLANAILSNEEIDLEELLAEILKLEDDANKLQCLEEAGIDNVEAYSQGMQIYYGRYPEKEYGL